MYFLFRKKFATRQNVWAIIIDNEVNFSPSDQKGKKSGEESPSEDVKAQGWRLPKPQGGGVGWGAALV